MLKIVSSGDWTVVDSQRKKLMYKEGFGPESELDSIASIQNISRINLSSHRDASLPKSS